MDFTQFAEAFALYGADVLALAAVTVAICFLLKKTFLKNAKKNAFLPFMVSWALYAAYCSITKMSAIYVFENFVGVSERAFSVGAAATLFNAVYERLKYGGALSENAAIVAALIEGYVSEENALNVAERIAGEIADSVREAEEAVYAVLKEFAEENVGDEEMKSLSSLIVKTLTALQRRGAA